MLHLSFVALPNKIQYLLMKHSQLRLLFSPIYFKSHFICIQDRFFAPYFAVTNSEDFNP